ncbi:hypothetical protein C0Z01_08240 [Photobacterium kishitanii]|uniref:Uncharacterized protein n=1 Tax=Photobacterium kishitanii TaxID=318456 RepID=A0A2T3QSK6_9GAMM|nr:DUF6172 family protein [Photobacterium kishitanii]KJG08399.1 hypothetical protein UB40_18230 [Photobacterium kishitanii]KJG55607.1 hypothetical protein UA38_18830 [Photobacterium kishitanii]KJG58373.1 hypothetical protein UA42_19990 [Photobacterium kishitanii]KJG64102.1 hypothetical protein UA40_18350 [Photobacterium kishitanii]KJG67305.1 hypothetical protein UA41_19575 [Photobacterium kishitanii]
MKKTFALTHPKKAAARVVESIKHDVKKYIRRERNKTLPAGTDFWDFDCKFGHTEQEAKVIHVKEINKYIDEAEKLELPSLYLEILAKPATRASRPDFDFDEE